MSRLNPIPNEPEVNPVELLDELIPQFAANKSELDSYTNICDREKAQIKDLMSKADVSRHEAGGWVATRSVQVKESMDEDKLLAVMKKHGITEAIKTREYVDMEALENYLYTTDMTEDFADDLAKCKTTKEVVALRLSKAKKKKEEN